MGTLILGAVALTATFWAFAILWGWCTNQFEALEVSEVQRRHKDRWGHGQ